MLITVTGRKTGKKYTTPVGYYQQDGYLWVLTSRDSNGGATSKTVRKCHYF